MQSLCQFLQPFTQNALSPEQLKRLEVYLDLLLKWNAKINLTGLRSPEEIVRRHFGESLFAGEQLQLDQSSTLIDFGSGAGFPGLPLMILAPHLQGTLIESRHKKVAFLREVIRALGLENANVYAGRGEQWQLKAGIVTMRAVEKFEKSLPVAASLVDAGGKLALLIGTSQAEIARNGLQDLIWKEALPIPQSRERILLIGSRGNPQGKRPR